MPLYVSSLSAHLLSITPPPPPPHLLLFCSACCASHCLPTHSLWLQTSRDSESTVVFVVSWVVSCFTPSRLDSTGRQFLRQSSVSVCVCVSTRLFHRAVTVVAFSTALLSVQLWPLLSLTHVAVFFLLLLLVMLLPVSVGLGLEILIDVSSPAHDPHCAGEILFLHWYPCEVFCTEVNNRSLYYSPRARERAMDVLCRSPFAWCQLHTTRRSTFATVSPNSHTAHGHVCPP